MSATIASRRRERQEKILRAIYMVAGGTTKMCAYEDIVVQAWKLWPEEFGLRGYERDYPDASDLHKPLYGPLKRDGLVRSPGQKSAPGMKRFGLTERGIESVRRVKNAGATAPSQRGRLGRDERAEILRLADRPAVRMLPNPAELLDTDLYDFYGVTVRTSPAEFAGRLKTVDAAIDAAIKAKDPSVDIDKVAMVAATRDALKEQHADLIAARAGVKEKARS